MSFGEAIKSVFSKYATFSGRARRSEFWYFYLFNILVSIGLSILGRAVTSLSFLSSLYSLAILIPSLAVAVRRFHDIGKSGWTYLYILIPSMLYLGYLMYFIFTVVAPYHSEGYEMNAELVKQLLAENSSSLAIMGILILISLIASIIFIVWMARDSEPGENKWGPNPKEQPEIINNTL